MNSSYYITTAIAYPNARPHLGFALEVVQADFLARYHKLFSSQAVFFQSGTDEHGLKVQRAAEAANREPAVYVAEQVEHFKKLFAALQIVPNRFIRTSDSDHHQIAQALWKACASDIEKRTYRAWYDIKQEEFLGSADEISDPAVFGIDPKYIELIEEENYFFLASRYSSQVRDLLAGGSYKIWPENRRSEMLNFLDQKGLHDVSISRDVRKLSWGVPVPGDSSQVMYVWFDALANYLTGVASLGADGSIECSELWPPSLHVIGKDVQRFHALLWPAMLLSAGLPTPQNLLVHGFVLADGQAMSKSLGNGVDPLEVIEEYGSDALRWYLLKAIPTQDDGDFSKERFAQVYASDLANDYGNLVSRVLAMVHKYTGGSIPTHPDETPVILDSVLHNAVDAYHKGVADLKIERALAAAQSLIVYSNRRIEESKPWELAKLGEAGQHDLALLLHELLDLILQVSLLLLPAMPTTAQRVLSEVFSIENAAEYVVRIGKSGSVTAGQPLGSLSSVLFPRVELTA